MKIKDLIHELEKQDDPRFKNIANHMGKMAERFKAHEMSEEDFQIKIETLVNLLDIYGLKEKIKYKVAAQMVEDLLAMIVIKGVTSLF
jgi:Lhr-like helicase